VLVGGGGGISYVPEKGSFVIVTRWEVGVLIIPVWSPTMAPLTHDRYKNWISQLLIENNHKCSDTTLTQQELKQTENYKDKPFANLESHQINNREEQISVTTRE
jgi:hypothetical protein